MGQQVKLIVTEGPRVRGLRVLVVGMLIAFTGFLIALVSEAFSLARFVMLIGWIVAAVGLAWHFAIMLGGSRRGNGKPKE
jgi:hypothetical protein